MMLIFNLIFFLKIKFILTIVTSTSIDKHLQFDNIALTERDSYKYFQSLTSKYPKFFDKTNCPDIAFGLIIIIILIIIILIF